MISLLSIQAADQIKKLYELFLKVDATQVEINPLGETPEGRGVYAFCELTLKGPEYFCINHGDQRVFSI